ncbi:MAG TPA: phosphoribosyltransferase family protein [Pyrinomonadaceae bacterium]|jgi:predicted phosphoribosyltransferase
MRFTNLRSAGRELALKLEEQRDVNDVIVLGIALGGLPVAFEVAQYLNVPLDLVIIRRLLTPQGPGSQTCAVNVAGSLVIDAELLPRPVVPSTPLDHFLADAIAELGRREQICRAGRPPIDLAGKTVILVDCGIRSGLTMQAAIGALRTKDPRQIIAAVPVASHEASAGVTALADDLIFLSQPEPFGHVGLWYLDFSRPGDDHVGELLQPAGQSV